MLLTRLPVPSRAGTVDPARAAVFYPVVGGGIGAFVAGVAIGAGEIWTPLIAATLALAAESMLTGGLHLDGLADCADGLAGRDREHRLRIMKDHSVGVYAATTLGLHLLVKVAALAALLAALPATQLLPLLIGVYATSRGMMLPPARLLAYARAEGTGRAVVQGLDTAATLAGLAAVVIGLLVVAWVDPGTAVLLALVAASSTAVVAMTARRVIGGVTGDVLGACAELSLVTMLLAALAVSA